MSGFWGDLPSKRRFLRYGGLMESMGYSEMSGLSGFSIQGVSAGRKTNAGACLGAWKVRFDVRSPKKPDITT
jgi:hypothetical protein